MFQELLVNKFRNADVQVQGIDWSYERNYFPSNHELSVVDTFKINYLIKVTLCSNILDIQ